MSPSTRADTPKVSKAVSRSLALRLLPLIEAGQPGDWGGTASKSLSQWQGIRWCQATCEFVTFGFGYLMVPQGQGVKLS